MEDKKFTPREVALAVLRKTEELYKAADKAPDKAPVKGHIKLAKFMGRMSAKRGEKP